MGRVPFLLISAVLLLSGIQFVAAGCSDNYKNWFENGVDCGGECSKVCTPSDLSWVENVALSSTNGYGTVTNSGGTSCPGRWSKTTREGVSMWAQTSNCYGSLPNDDTSCAWSTLGTALVAWRLGSDISAFSMDVVMHSSDDDTSGVVFNYRNTDNFYMVSANEGNQCTGLYKRTNGRSRYVVRRTGSSFRRPRNRYWHLRIEATPVWVASSNQPATRFQVWADWSETTIKTPANRLTWVSIIDYIDTSPLYSGAVGFVTGGDQNSRFLITRFEKKFPTCDTMLSSSSSFLRLLIESDLLEPRADGYRARTIGDSSGAGTYYLEQSMLTRAPMKRTTDFNGAAIRWTPNEYASLIGGTQSLDSVATGMTLTAVVAGRTRSTRQTSVIWESQYMDNGARAIFFRETFDSVPDRTGWDRSNTKRSCCSQYNWDIQRTRGLNNREWIRTIGTGSDRIFSVQGGGTARFITGWIDLSSANNACINFQYREYGSMESSDELRLYYRDFGSSTWVDIWNKRDDASTSWRTANVCGRISSRRGWVQVQLRIRASWYGERWDIRGFEVNAQAAGMSLGIHNNRLYWKVARAGQLVATTSAPFASDIGRVPAVVSVDTTYTGGRTTARAWINGVSSVFSPQAPSFAGMIRNEHQWGSSARLGGNTAQHDLYHMRLYQRTLSTAQRGQIEQALMRRFATTASCPSALAGASNAIRSSGDCNAGTANNKQCVMVCATGNALVSGALERTCKDGRWTDDAPVCLPACSALTPTGTDGCWHGHVGPLAFGTNGAAGSAATTGFTFLPFGDERWTVTGGYLQTATDTCGNGRAYPRMAIFPSSAVREATGAVNASVRVWAAAGGKPEIIMRAAHAGDTGASASGFRKDGGEAQLADHYAAQVDVTGKKVVLFRRKSGANPVVMCTKTVSTLAASTWYTLAVQLEREKYLVTLDGDVMCDVSDGAADGRTSGDFGVGSEILTSQVRFDDFQVFEQDLKCESGCTAAAGQSCHFECKLPLQAQADATLTRTCSAPGTYSGTDLVCALPKPVMTNQVRSILEGEPLGTAVGDPVNYTLNDPTKSLEVRFRITSQDVADAFQISECGGQVSVKSPDLIDYELPPRPERYFLLQAEAATEGDFTGSATAFTIRVNILDRNEPAIFASQTRSVSEIAAVGTNIGGVLTAVDPEGDAIAWSIRLGNLGDALAVGSSSGQMTVAKAGVLDYETRPAMSVIVRAADTTDATVYSEATVTIDVQDANEPPRWLITGNISATVSELANVTALTPPSQMATAFVDLSTVARDDDAGQTVSFRLVSSGGGFVGPDTSALQIIDNSLYLAAGVSLDYEVRPELLAVLEAADDSVPTPLRSYAQFRLAVTDEDEPPTITWPADGALTTTEGAAGGTSVGTIVGTDPDAGQTVVYSMVAQFPAGEYFAINQLTGEVTVSALATAIALDAESTATHTLTISAADSSGAHSMERNVTVTITGVDEPPQVTGTGKPNGGGVATLPYSTAEHGVADSVLATLPIADPEGSAVRFSIVSQVPTEITAAVQPAERASALSGNPFSVDATTGELKRAVPALLDFERFPKWTVNISAEDKGGVGTTSRQAFFAVMVSFTDVNDAPVLPATIRINHPAVTDGDVGAPLSSVLVDDELLGPRAASESHTFAITAGADARVSIADASTGRLAVVAGQQNNLQQGNVFSFTVTVTDSTSLTATATVEITVVSGNAKPTIDSMSTATGTGGAYAIEENAAAGTTLLTLVVNDASVGQLLAVTLAPEGDSAPRDGLFPFEVSQASGIAQGATVTVRVKSGGLLDFEGPHKAFKMAITVTDDFATAPLSVTQTVDVEVTNVAEAPYFDKVLRVPSSVEMTTRVSESAAAGTALDVVVSATLVTANATITANEDDAGDSVTYSIDAAMAGGCPGIGIHATGGQLTVTDPALLDFETSPERTCGVIATDTTSRTDSATVIVRLVDGQDAPVIPASQAFSVAEGAAASAGRLVGTVRFSDQDVRPEWGMPTIALVRGDATAGDLVNASLAASKELSGAAATADAAAAMHQIAGGAEEMEDLLVAALFSIDATTGQLTVRDTAAALRGAGVEDSLTAEAVRAAVINWEARRSMAVRVRVSDAAGLDTLGTATLTVTNADDALASIVYLDADGPPPSTDTSGSSSGTGEETGGDPTSDGGDATGNSTAPGSAAQGEARGSVELETRGGETIVFRGLDMAPTGAELLRNGETITDYRDGVRATYGQSGSATFTAANCFVRTGRDVVCDSVEGYGTGHVWSIHLPRPAGMPDEAVTLAATVSTSYKPPNVTAVSLVGVSELPTVASPASPVRMRIEGTNFGPRGAPTLKVSYSPAGSDHVFEAANCNWRVPHTEVECDAVSGWGANLVFTVSVAGVDSIPARSSISYQAPTLASVAVTPVGYDASETTLMRTMGSEAVTLTGTGFPATAGLVALSGLRVEYAADFAEPHRTYTAADCAVGTAGTVLTCRTVEGYGTDLRWRVVVGTQASDTGLAASALPVTHYRPPVVEGVEGPGAVNGATTGGEFVFLRGSNFGPLTQLNASGDALEAAGGRPDASFAVFPSTVPMAEYGYPTAASVAEGALAAGVPFAFDSARNRYAGVRCRVLGAHTLIRCETDEGVGKELSWRVSIGGQRSDPRHAIAGRSPAAESADLALPVTSYHPPVVSLEEGETAAVDVLSLDTNGNQRVRIRGLHFGARDADLGEVKYGILGAVDATGASNAAGDDADNVFVATSCSIETPHTTILCTTAEGAGSDHRWRVIVGQQPSVQPTTAYARPVIDGFEGSAARDSRGLSPRGSQQIILVGRFFGTSRFLETVRFGKFGQEFTARNCTVVIPHTKISCETPAAPPSLQARWTVQVAGQVSDLSDAVTPFADPVLSSAAPMASATEGGVRVTVTGVSWGLGTEFSAAVAARLQVTNDSPFPAGSLALKPVGVTGNDTATATSWQVVDGAAEAGMAVTAASREGAGRWAGTVTAPALLSTTVVDPSDPWSEERAEFVVPEGFGADRLLLISAGYRTGPNVAVSHARRFHFDAPVISRIAADRAGDVAPGNIRVFVEGASFCNHELMGCGLIRVDGTPVIARTWAHDTIELETRTPTAADPVVIQVCVDDVNRCSAPVSFVQARPGISDRANPPITDAPTTGGGELVIRNVTDADSVDGVRIGPYACTGLSKQCMEHCNPSPGNTQPKQWEVRCTMPAGVGMDHGVVLEAGGDDSFAGSLTVSFMPPAVARVEDKANNAVLFQPPNRRSRGLAPAGSTDGFPGIPTAGATVRIFGSSLGTDALGNALDVPAPPMASLTEVGSVSVSATDAVGTQAWVDVVIGPGEGKDLDFTYSVGGQSVTSGLRYRAPTVTGVNPLLSETPRTNGGFVVDITGVDFGVSGMVGVTVGGRPCTVPPSGAAFSGNLYRCVAPPGAGSAAPVALTVAGQTGTSTLAYAPPEVTAVSPGNAPSSAVDASTGERILFEVTGTNFGLDEAGTLELWWTPPGASAPALLAAFSNSTAPPSSPASPLRGSPARRLSDQDIPLSLLDPPAGFSGVLVWTHERIVVQLPPSAGQVGVYPVVVAADQTSGLTAVAAGATLSYDAPSVTSISRVDRTDCAPREICFGENQCRMFPAGCYSTTGGYVVSITGASFGVPDPALRPTVTIGGIACLAPPSPAAATHDSVQCVMPAGIGDVLPVVVRSPLGRENSPSADGSGAIFAYDPPIVRALVPNTPDASGDDIDIVGANFGGIPSPVRIVIDGVECATTNWVNDQRIYCRSPELTVGPKNVSIYAANRTEAWDIFAWEGLFVTECKSGSYGVRGEVCISCEDDVPGAVCPGGEMDFDLVRSQPGWWRVNVSGSDADCPHASVRGARDGTPHFCPSLKPCEPTFACLGENTCIEGYTGERCGRCDSGFYRISGLCEKCPDNPWLTPILLAVLVVCAGIGGWVMNQKQARQPLFMIGVDGAQVLAMFARTRVSWPPAVQTLLRLLSALNLNIELVAPECIIPDVTITLKFYVSVGLPVAVAALFLLLFAAKYVYKACCTAKRKDQLTAHVPSLVSALIVLSRVLYLFATRAALEPLNCVPTDPPEPNGFEYMSGLVDVPCWQEGSIQVSLLPVGIIALGLYTVAAPVLLAMFLRRNRQAIKHDQILRAAGCGNDRLSSPKLYRFRRTWSQAYYMFKPGKASYWLLVIFARKLGISVAALMFRTTPSYQLAIALLVLFAAYVAQTKNQPFMSRRDQGLVLAEHRSKVLHDMTHARIEADIQEAARKNFRKARKTPALFDITADAGKGGKGGSSAGRRNQSLGRAGALAVVRMADYNAAESTLLAVAVCVCLSGLMFASDRFSASRIDLYRAEYEGLAYVVVALVSLAIIYFLTVLFIDISFSFNPTGTAACIERTCSTCIGRCTAVVKGQSSKGGKLASTAKTGGVMTTDEEAQLATADLGASGSKGAAAAAAATRGGASGRVSMAANPTLAGGGTKSRNAMLGVSDDPTDGLPAELAELTGPPSADMWPAVKQWMLATAEQTQQLKIRVADMQRRQVAGDVVGDPPAAVGGAAGVGPGKSPTPGAEVGVAIGRSASRRRASSSTTRKAQFAPQSMGGNSPAATAGSDAPSMAKLGLRGSSGRRRPAAMLSRPRNASSVGGSDGSATTASENPLHARGASAASGKA